MSKVFPAEALPRLSFMARSFLDYIGFEAFASKSYSQEGEDLILKRLFGACEKGFYVDVGAHHPKRFSNTFLFYKMGWRGINIDAMPGSMRAFQRHRPKDINIEVPIAEEKKKMTYFQFNDPALNGFDNELSRIRDDKPKYKVVKKIELLTHPLKEILHQNMPAGQTIDFISVDVEGLDLEVLRSNDWLVYRPKVILVESMVESLSKIESDPIHIFLTSKNYQLYIKSVRTIFYCSKEYLLKKDV